MNIIDSHTHLLAVAAGIGSPWGAEGVRKYHEAHALAGTAPMDDPFVGPLPGDLDARLRGALQILADHGVVEMHEMGVPRAEILDALERLRDAGELPVRVRAFLSLPLFDAGVAVAPSAELDVAGVKLYLDGWLGPRTAALRDPWPGTDERGILFRTAEQLLPIAEGVADAGLAIASHAIGDRAVATALDVYERLYGDDCAAQAPRIEHCSMLRDEDIQRMMELGVVASIQWSFAPSDADHIAALGEQQQWAYRWQDLQAAGVQMIAGSDHPIETLDPTVGLRDLEHGIEVAGQQYGALGAAASAVMAAGWPRD